MRKGDPAEGLEFFDLLYADKNFCKEFGRCMLAASRLETKLIAYFMKKKILKKPEKHTLGTLIRLAEKNNMLNQILPAMKVMKNQRNYLTHNLYFLFSGLINETLLPRSDLIDSDVDMFTDRASQLRKEFQTLGNIISKPTFAD